MSAYAIAGWITEVEAAHHRTAALYSTSESPCWLGGEEEESGGLHHEDHRPPAKRRRIGHLKQPRTRPRPRRALAEMDGNAASTFHPRPSSLDGKRRTSPRRREQQSLREAEIEDTQADTRHGEARKARGGYQVAGTFDLVPDRRQEAEDQDHDQSERGGKTPRQTETRSLPMEKDTVIRRRQTSQETPSHSTTTTGSPSRQRRGRKKADVEGKPLQQVREGDGQSVGSAPDTWSGRIATDASAFAPRRDFAPSQPSSSATSTSKRSRSPAKSRSDLEFANIEFRTMETSLATLPPSVHALFNRLKAAGAGMEIVPEVVQRKISTGPSLTLDCSNDFNIATHYHLSDEVAALAELERVREIVADAAECRRENLSEATWNGRVHDPLLRLAFARTNAKNWPVTTAAIIPGLIPRNNLNGDLFSRLVDFAITLELPSPGPERDAITHLLSAQATPLRYLNQTTYDPLRFRPAPIAVETKVETAAETGETQLAVWTRAWRTRMALLGAGRIPVQPLVRVRGHNWMVLFAWDEEEGDGEEGGREEQVWEDNSDGRGPKLVVMGELLIGDTRTALGIYKILKAMRLLAEWMDTDFRKWFVEEVLGFEE